MVLKNLNIKYKYQRDLLNSLTAAFNYIRYGHVMRGKPPGVAKSLAQRLQEINVQDPDLAMKVDIGFPKLKPSRSQNLKERLNYLKLQRSNPEFEKKSRSGSLLIDLDEVEKDYTANNRCFHLRVIADHYGIYNDLFGPTAYFIPRVPLNVEYLLEPNTVLPVYNGNIIKPKEALEMPDVKFDGTIDPITGKPTCETSYWTLLATNPDGHFTSRDKEYIHWFVANIPDGNVPQGEEIVKYLAPFPPKGIGYQRFIFVLYKQNKKLDFSKYQLNTNDYNNLEKRTFQTLDFYRKYQDDITPAGLAFYQTDYDNSLTTFYHNILNIKQPIYEYDFPKIYSADQKFFPLRKSFNMYMDRYRDIKQVNKEYLERKLAKTHPFEGPEPPLRFPNAHPIRDVPSWLCTEIRKERLKRGRISDY